MDQSSRRSDEAARALWSWLGFWLQFLILGILAVIGAFVASGDERPGDYACGMLLMLSTIALSSTSTAATPIGPICCSSTICGTSPSWSRFSSSSGLPACSSLTLGREAR